MPPIGMNTLNKQASGKRLKRLSTAPLKRGLRFLPKPLLWLYNKPLPRLRLSHQLIGFFALVVLLPLLALSFSIYTINLRAVQKQVSQFTIHTAESVYSELSLELHWQREQARLAGDYWLTILNSRQASAQQAHIREYFHDNPLVTAVAFYSATGQREALFLAPHRDTESPIPPREITPQTQLDMTLHPIPNPGKTGENEYQLEVMVPLKDKVSPGSKVQTVVFSRRFPVLGYLIRQRLQTFDDGFMLVDATGTVVAGPRVLRAKPLPVADMKVFHSLQEGMVKETRGQAAIQAKNGKADPDDALLDKVFIKVPTLGWGLILESPYRLEKSYIGRARNQTMGLLFLCVLSIIVSGLLYSRGINRNFRQLIKGVKALAEGRYSRKIRLITKSWTPYEIVYLTAEVNRMATKISTAWSSIQKLNRELVFKNEQDVFVARAVQRLHGSLEWDNVGSVAVALMLDRPGILSAQLYLQPESGLLSRAAVAPESDNADADADIFFPAAERRFLEIQHEPQHARRLTELPASGLNDTLPADARVLLQPVVYQEDALGILVLLLAPPDAEGMGLYDDRIILDLLASQIAVAIHQARQWQAIQQANQQLAALDELKSTLIDTVSHELRTPLTNIKGYTSRLIRNDGSLDRETELKSLKVIKQQADRLGRLVEDLLVIPELERGEGIRVYPDRVNLQDLVSRCVGFMEEKANREIAVHALSQNNDILVDPDRMEQVLLNLLDNAIKYSDEGAVIEVSTRQATPEWTEISVFNRCAPIRPDELAQLFTKFKRLDERLTRTTRGTGLGLFITKGLVEAMGGSIGLDADGGFRVTVKVPAVTQENEASVVF